MKTSINKWSSRLFMALATLILLTFAACEPASEEGTTGDGNTTADTIDKNLIGSWKNTDEYGYGIFTFDKNNIFTNVYYNTDDSYDEGFKATYKVKGCVINLNITHILNDDNGSFDAIAKEDLEDQPKPTLAYEFNGDKLTLYFIDGAVSGSYDTIAELKEDYPSITGSNFDKCEE